MISGWIVKMEPTEHMEEVSNTVGRLKKILFITETAVGKIVT